MTEERKRELRRLLEEAFDSLVIRFGYGGFVCLPVEVYQKYLEERWRYFGVDFLSFAFMIRLKPDINDEVKKSNLIQFVRQELAPFVDDCSMNDTVPTASYFIKSCPKGNLMLHNRQFGRLPLSLVIERLLQISVVRTPKAAVEVFDRCSRVEGTFGFFQDVNLLEGIKLDKEFQVLSGVRLVPLPTSDLSDEVTLYLPGFPQDAFFDLMDSFFGKTLLVIDEAALSIFHSPAPDPTYPQGHPVENLPVTVEKQDLRYRNATELNYLKQRFCQALSLVCNCPVQITHGGWFLDEEKTFNPHHETISMFRPPTPIGNFGFGGCSEADEDDIVNARYLYSKLVKLKPSDMEKLQIGIGRWMKSKAIGGYVDKVIDLGIAFESLYLPGIKDELTFRLGVRAAWYLGKDEDHRKELMTKFGDIYKHRSNAVHDGQLGERVNFGGKPVPISVFIEKSQDLCRESIMKILDDGGFPDWGSLILGGDMENAQG